MIGQVSFRMEMIEADGDEQVVLMLGPKVERTSNRNKRYVIFCRDLWRYTQEMNPEGFEAYVGQVCTDVWDVLDLGIPSAQDKFQLASLVQHTIDLLSDCIADSEKDADKTLTGEGVITLVDRQRNHAEQFNVAMTKGGLMVVQ
ncbi:MAG: hypothetical protein JW724_03260 [Candidatus Altiarchaeota archaeon]|nr:hypothetical protein [Candidatus Altiarchaeota archaeon]